MIISKCLPVSFLFIFVSLFTVAQSDTTLIPNTIPATDTSQNFVYGKTANLNKVYILKPAVDIPIVAAGTTWSLYAFTKIYSKGAIPQEKILSLNKKDI